MSNHFYYGDNLTVLRESIQMRAWTSSPSTRPSTRTRVQGRDLNRCPVKPLCVD